MRLPVDKLRVTPHGAFDYPRAKRRHHGVDLAGPTGTRVLAPERLDVLVVMRDGKVTSVPALRGVGLKGYHPAAVLARGASGVIHVLGHLTAAALPGVGQVVPEGGIVGTISRVGHVHWEVRKPDRAPWPRARRGDDVLDPLALLSGNRTLSSHGPLDRAAAAVRSAVVAHVIGDALPFVLLLLLWSRRRRR